MPEKDKKKKLTYEDIIKELEANNNFLRSRGRPFDEPLGGIENPGYANAFGNTYSEREAHNIEEKSKSYAELANKRIGAFLRKVEDGDSKLLELQQNLTASDLEFLDETNRILTPKEFRNELPYDTTPYHDYQMENDWKDRSDPANKILDMHGRLRYMEKINYNTFDAPIPGQSLTDEPKNAAWEHPPQFVEMEAATEYVWDQLTQPKHMKRALTMMNNGVSAEALARTILFTGFVNGKWNVDLAMMMAKPLTGMFMGLAGAAGMDKVKVGIKDRQKDDTAYKMKLAELMSKPAEEPSMGFMSPEGGM